MICPGHRIKWPFNVGTLKILCLKFLFSTDNVLTLIILDSWCSTCSTMAFKISEKVSSVYFFITCQSEAWKTLHILRYPTCSIQWVVFQSAFPPLLASDYRNGAKTVCVRFRNGAKTVCLRFLNGAKVVGQRRESFLHKELKTSAQTAVLVLRSPCGGQIS